MKKVVIRMLIGALIGTIGLGLQWVLWPWMDPNRFILLYPTILIAPLVAGLPAGLTATALCALGSILFFITASAPHFVVQTATFFTIGTILTVLVVILKKRTLQLSLEQMRREDESLRSLLVQNMLHGFGFCKLIYGQTGTVQDFIFLDTNPAFERLTGVSHATGKRITEIAPNIRKTNPQLFEIVARVAKEGKPETFEIEIPDLNRWFSVSIYSPMPGHVAQIFDNITERKTAEAKLQQDHALLQVMFDHSVQLAGLLSPDGKLIRVNQHARDFVNATDSKIIGKYFWETPFWTHSAQLQQQLHEGILAASHGEFVHFEANHIDRNGNKIDVDFSLKPVLDKSGKVVFIIPEGRDISERKRIELALSTSEQRLRAIIENEPECVKILSSAGTIREMNKAGLDMLEVDSLTEAQSHSLADFVDPKYVDSLCSLIDQIFRGESGKLEFEMCGIKGTRRWIETHAVPLRNEQGQVDALLGITRDITERKQFEEARAKRHELEERIASIAETAPGALVAFCLRPDESMYFPYVSPALAELYELSPEAIMKDAALTFTRIHPADHEQVKQSIQESAHSLKPWRAEFRILNPTRGLIWVEGYSRPFKQKDGTVLWHGFLTEISARKKAAQDLLAAKEAAESAAKTQATFLNIAAHELRTPISSISLLLQLAAKQLQMGQSLSPEFIQRMNAPSDRLKTLVTDLLDLSRLERGIVVLRLVDTDLVSLIDDVIGEFRIQAPHRKFDFTKLPEPLHIMCDPIRINQVLSNILDNAIKYTPDQSTITVNIVTQQDTVRVSIRDQGPGIPQNRQKYLFQAFSRGSSDETIRASGLGLGLSISRRILELHHGSIGVISEEGKGSTFYFDLPRNLQEQL